MTLILDGVQAPREAFCLSLSPTHSPERRFAAIAVDVCDGVQPREEDALLGGAAPDVHHGVEQVGATLAALWTPNGRTRAF